MNNQNFQKGNLYLIIAIIIGVFAIGVVGFASWKYFSESSELEKEKSQPSYLPEQEKTIPQVEEQEEIKKEEIISSKKTNETANWKTYRNEEYGFELKYPQNVLVNDGSNKNNKTTLYIIAEKIDDLGTSQPWSLDKETALKDKNAIKKGDPSVSFGFEIKDSCKIINIPGTLSKEFVILQALEVCNVQFTKKAFIYYKDNYRIRLNWQLGSEEMKKIIENNPNYFTVNSANCGNYKIWKDQNNFYRDLVDKKTDSVSQKWINDFREILLTLKFTVTDEISDWKTYQNEEYGYEIKYPSLWEIIVESDGLIRLGVINGQDFSMSLRVFNKSIEEAEKLMPVFSIPSRTVNNRTNISVGDIDWVKLIVNKHQIVQLTYHNGKTYGAQYSTFENISPQILSTFKFTD